ncbi:type II toxin-antitoxin system RelE/ParE family toxin [Mucilaginibacter antarcticus]|uniref:type II toxin-antitoxin system RelE/ParE family toxin n=1 Tax=Mucilaginibacter antarcticus TaxID=1855725 RepID=UPI003645C685
MQDKIIWTFDLIEALQKIPETYLKHLENTDGLYEIRVQQGSDIFRIFCFFDQGQLIVLTNGFQKKTQKTPKQEIERALKIKEEYGNEKSNVMTLAEFKDKTYGKPGTARRDQLDAGYETFKIGAMIHEARIEKGLTQEELAEKVGTTKSYISKLENNIKEVRFSTLKKSLKMV